MPSRQATERRLRHRAHLGRGRRPGRPAPAARLLVLLDRRAVPGADHLGHGHRGRGPSRLRRLRHLLGDRAGLAATLVSTVLLLVLIVPLAMLSRALVDDVAGLAGAAGPRRPDDSAAARLARGWPVIGPPLDQFWHQASGESRPGAGAASSRSCRRSGVWLLSFVAGAGFGMLSFMAAIVIAGVLLAHSVASRAAGRGRSPSGSWVARGADLVLLAEHTIRGVARGVLGTALIQSILVGIGLVVGRRSRAPPS